MRGAHSCKTSDRQQYALDPSTTCQKRNTETCARICLAWVGDKLNAATGMTSKREDNGDDANLNTVPAASRCAALANGAAVTTPRGETPRVQ